MRISKERKWTAHDKKAIALQIGLMLALILLYIFVKFVVINSWLILAILATVVMFGFLVFLTMFLLIGWFVFFSNIAIDRTLQGKSQVLILILGSGLVSCIFVETAKLMKIVLNG